MRLNSTINKGNWLILCCLSLLLLQGCNKKFLGFKFSNKDEIKIDAIQYDYFSSKAKFKYKNGDDKVKATANIRIKKDSIIWMSLGPGISIEAARVKITQDSLVIIDRVNKQVIRHNFETLSQSFNFEIGYDLLQAIIMGDLPIPMTSQDMVDKQANHFVMTQERGDLAIENSIGLKTRKLESLKATSSKSQSILELKYGEFKLVDEHAYPHKALLVLNYLINNQYQAATVDIEHNRTQIEKKALRFPFNIPRRYERK